MTNDPLMETARRAARSGGRVIANAFLDGFKIHENAKGDAFNLVTSADQESERQIAKTIREAFPDHAIIGEEDEQGDPNAEHLWIIDPLDGTNNFAHHIPHCAVSIAYYYRGQPECGVIVNPVRDDWFETRRGRGAFLNGERVHVNDHRTLDQTMVGAGFYYDRGPMMEATLAAIRDLFRQQIHGIRRFGTASLDLCAVGCGQYGGFFEYMLSPWDFAAGRLFVEEAGGRVTTCRGDDLPIGVSSVLVSNGHLHLSLQQIVSQHLPEDC